MEAFDGFSFLGAGAPLGEGPLLAMAMTSRSMAALACSSQETPLYLYLA